MVDYLAAEVEAGERGGPTLARGPVGVRVNWAAISTHVRIKLKNNPNNKQTFAGQAEAIVRSAAAAAAGQDDDFADDPEEEDVAQHPMDGSSLYVLPKEGEYIIDDDDLEIEDKIDITEFGDERATSFSFK